MTSKPLLYFKNHIEWRNWLHENHAIHSAVELIFYKVDSEMESMRWEEAVKVAICYGWIDSTVRKLDEERRKQTFTPRKDKSVWSKVNKNYITELIKNGLMHESGLRKIEIAKQNGSDNCRRYFRLVCYLSGETGFCLYYLHRQLSTLYIAASPN